MCQTLLCLDLPAICGMRCGSRYCQANNIAVTAYFSLGGSFQHAQTGTVQTLTEISTAKGKSTSQVLLRWALQHGASIIPGTGNPKHMRAHTSREPGGNLPRKVENAHLFR